MRKHIILTVLKLIYTVLLTNNSYFTGMANAPNQLCHQLIGFQELRFCCLQLQNNVIYYNNNFTRRFFMIVSTSVSK